MFNDLAYESTPSPDWEKLDECSLFLGMFQLLPTLASTEHGQTQALISDFSFLP